MLLTISAHSNGDAFLQPTVLTPVPVDPEYGTLLVFCARPVLDLLLNAASKESL